MKASAGRGVGHRAVSGAPRLGVRFVCLSSRCSPWRSVRLLPGFCLRGCTATIILRREIVVVDHAGVASLWDVAGCLVAVLRFVLRRRSSPAHWRWCFRHQGWVFQGVGVAAVRALRGVRESGGYPRPVGPCPNRSSWGNVQRFSLSVPDLRPRCLGLLPLIRLGNSE